MANGNKLYSAYRGAGKAAASYKASLYDIENLGIEREGSAAAHQFRMQEFSKHAALAQQAVGLVSDIAGGQKAKKESEAARGKVQEGMAKKAYTGDVEWDKLGDTARASQLEKFAPEQVKQDWVGKLLGEEKKYTFGESADEFTGAEITAASAIYGEETLADKLGVGAPAKKVEELQESFKSEVKETSKDTGLPDASGDTTATVAGKDDPYGYEEGAEYMVVPGFENMGLNTKPKEPVNLNKISDSGKGGKPAISTWKNLMDEKPTSGFRAFAKGGEYTTDGPEVILVGDNPGGKEKVKVTPIKSKGKEKLADNIGVSLKDLVSKKGSKPGSKKWINEYISNQKINNESLRPLQGELSKHNKKLFSMAEESGYFGEFFRGGWE